MSVAAKTRRPGDPDPVECAGCGDAIHGSKGVDRQPYCDDCIDREEWLRASREHSALVREGRIHA